MDRSPDLDSAGPGGDELYILEPDEGALFVDGVDVRESEAEAGADESLREP